MEAFPESNVDELAFAIAELESDGYLKTTSFVSKRLPRMFTTPDLFITFDPHTGKSNPEADVVALVDLALGRPQPVRSELKSCMKRPAGRFDVSTRRLPIWSRRSTTDGCFRVAQTTIQRAAF